MPNPQVVYRTDIDLRTSPRHDFYVAVEQGVLLMGYDRQEVVAAADELLETMVERAQAARAVMRAAQLLINLYTHTDTDLEQAKETLNEMIDERLTEPVMQTVVCATLLGELLGPQIDENTLEEQAAEIRATGPQAAETSASEAAGDASPAPMERVPL